MRSFLAALVGTVVLTGIASAQPPAAKPSPAAGRLYVEIIGQSTFGNATSQAYSGEVGFTLKPQMQVFAEVGWVLNTAPGDLGSSAQLIATWLSRTQSNAGYKATQPATFGVGGLRYRFPLSTKKFEPYVTGGAGAARVRRDVTFTVGGADVTNNLAQYGVVLGSDLTLSETKPMLTVGAGVVWLGPRNLIVDVQYRYGRIFTSDQGTNVNRVGAGLGVRF